MLTTFITDQVFKDSVYIWNLYSFRINIWKWDLINFYELYGIYKLSEDKKNWRFKIN